MRSDKRNGKGHANECQDDAEGKKGMDDGLVYNCQAETFRPVALFRFAREKSWRSLTRERFGVGSFGVRFMKDLTFSGNVSSAEAL